MNQLNLFGEIETEISPGLARLWDVIGVAGSRLDRSRDACHTLAKVRAT